MLVIKTITNTDDIHGDGCDDDDDDFMQEKGENLKYLYLQ
jgi:hypothetical protein